MRPNGCVGIVWAKQMLTAVPICLAKMGSVAN